MLSDKQQNTQNTCDLKTTSCWALCGTTPWVQLKGSTFEECSFLEAQQSKAIVKKNIYLCLCIAIIPMLGKLMSLTINRS